MKYKYKDVVVIVPIYKNNLSPLEMTSLYYCKFFLKEFNILVVSPASLSKDNVFNDFINKEDLYVKYFDNKYFTSIDGYNNLMLSLDFYKTFTDYKYMLICQLDALVLSNDLLSWVNKDYDYVGAPWVSDGNVPILDSAGNGGFSLRKIKTFISVLESKKIYYTTGKYNTVVFRASVRNMIILKILKKLKKYNFSFNYINIFLFLHKGYEDYFWTFYAKFFIKEFKLATIEESLKFSFEVNPRFCFKENNKEFPFGAHAWQKYDLEFWLNNIPGLREKIKKYDLLFDVQP